ncbi:hypothetical protein PV325_002578 [Microctonus aethiopoides]|nr:hypothetical protein PV325_002578 [Microctonus aethiopoides]
MDSRGPQEARAPGDSLDSIFMGHNANLSSKNNNRLFFLTVEYVEDHQSRDYTKMFLPYEQVSFSSRAASPLSDFEHRVSPLDPNMSSTARYSPTPVQLPSVPFQNSVVVLQGPPSPLITPSNDTNIRTNINFISAPSNSVPITRQTDNVTDFVNNTNDEGLVTSVGGELILMQGTNTELVGSNAPLMLASIPGTEFSLTRDFLVMNDEQLNMMGSLTNQNSEIIEEQVDEVDMDNQTLRQSDDKDEVLEEICQEITTDKTFVEDEILKNFNKSIENDDIVESLISEKSDVRRPKRKINDKTFGCEECDMVCSKVGECMCHKVCTIADQPVPSRAIATLPGSYLTLNKLTIANEITAGKMIHGIYAKRNIRRRTQFGPIEGILCSYNGESFDNALPLIYETIDKQLLKVDVSNENTSNWMRFVRPATNYNEQNLIICQQNDGIFFLTIRDIVPEEELKAGPSSEYAKSRNLKILQADSDAKDKNTTINNDECTWLCHECDQRFPTCQIFKKHLNVHDNQNLSAGNTNTNNNNNNNKRRKLSVTADKLMKVVGGQTLLYTCPHCPKVFPRSYSLKRHMLMHSGTKAPRYECTTCGENFLHPYNRNRHIKIFHSEEMREKENTLHNINEWKCLTCSLTFEKSSLLSIHALVHSKDVNVINKHDESLECPQCGTEFKRHDLINHVAKHGIMKLPKTTKISAVVSSHKCTMCYKRFATKVRLQQHYLVHGAEDKKPLPCNVCFKRFMNNSALSCHLKTHRQDKQIFECPMCRELFNQVLMLKSHIETHKNADETFTCPHCPRIFSKYSVIRKHIRAYHCERKHKCQFCVKCFPTIDKLRMHLLRHSDYREFHCANCEKRFKRKDKLKEHMTRMHNAQKAKREQKSRENNNQAKKFIPKVNPTDYNRFVYKCHRCLVGFKRRGMLVNHLAKRHPDVSPDSVPELNMPILRQTRDYYCQYCVKVYKSSSKRKAHIMKNHPGAALPPSNRQKETDVPGLPNPTFSQTVGSITTRPQSCQWCHKQYASKAKLLQHQRKKHSTLMEPADQIPRPRNRLTQNQSSPLNSNNNFILSEYITYDIDSNVMKPKIIKASNDVDFISHGLEIVGQQFVRIRDIR